MRIGLLGGSFNPVHNAHLRVAEAARDICRLDKVLFIPAADPPHKPLAGNISFDCRSLMVGMAIAGTSNFELSTIEAERSGKSYSIDTIRVMRELYREDDLYFIIGGDSFRDIGSWHRYDEIFNECSLIVVERPGCRVAVRPDSLPASLRDAFFTGSEPDRLTHRSGRSVVFVTGTPLDLSSTEIRRRASSGGDISDCVPPEVAAYILQQRIYHSCR